MRFQLWLKYGHQNFNNNKHSKQYAQAQYYFAYRVKAIKFVPRHQILQEIHSIVQTSFHFWVKWQSEYVSI